MSDGQFQGDYKRRRRTRSAVNVFPTLDEIADRAYQLFVAEGKRADRVTEYWRRAEDELLARAARRIIG